MTEWLNVLTGIATLAAAIIGLMAVYRKQMQTHDLINSRMDEMLRLARAESLAIGQRSGTEQEQERVATQLAEANKEKDKER